MTLAHTDQYLGRGDDSSLPGLVDQKSLGQIGLTNSTKVTCKSMKQKLTTKIFLIILYGYFLVRYVYLIFIFSFRTWRTSQK